MHGIDEEPRAYVSPIIVNRNRYGDELGAVGLWVKNYDKSLCGGNYKGGNWYIIAVEGLFGSVAPETVEDILKRAAGYCRDGCYISRLCPEFALYDKGERVRVNFTVENTGDSLQSAEIVIGYDENSVIKRDIAAEIPLFSQKR